MMESLLKNKRKADSEQAERFESVYLDTEGILPDLNEESLANDIFGHEVKKSRRKPAQTTEEMHRADKAERQLTEELFGKVDQSLYSTHVTSQFENKIVDEEKFGDDGDFEVDFSENEVSLQENHNETEQKAAWIDEDDLSLNFRATSKPRKIRKSQKKIIQNKKEYMQKLNDNFSQAFGDEPEWAALPKKKTENVEFDFNKTTGIYLASKQESSRTALPKRELQIKAGKDLNAASYSEGSIINCCEFNPKFEVSFVAGCSKDGLGSATLFQVDGTHNHKVQSVKFPKFPIKCGQFLHDGRKFIVGSLHSHFFAYDLDSGKQIRIPWNPKESSNNRKYFKVSPCGRWLAFVGSQGSIDIYDAGKISYIESFKVPGEVSSLCFSKDGNALYTHGDLGKVHIFDMARRSCIHSFYDSGCLSGISIDVSCRGTLACGSSSGIVNLYNTSEIMSSSSPSPTKAFGKLVTTVNHLKFNHSGEMLASASSDKEDAFKLIHVPSATYFVNFPMPNVALSRVNSIAFSPGDGFLSIGNNKATAKLYRLHHFSKY